MTTLATTLQLINLLMGGDNLPTRPFLDPGPVSIKVCPGLNYPAVTSVYEPALGGINCDHNCGYVAIGSLENWMYGTAGACPSVLLYYTIHFPGIGHKIRCVDRGGAIEARWSEARQQCVVYFDTLWHLEEDEDGRLLGAPEWNYWMINEWYVTP